jgi:hypothetical protein
MCPGGRAGRPGRVVTEKQLFRSSSFSFVDHMIGGIAAEGIPRKVALQQSTA